MTADIEHTLRGLTKFHYPRYGELPDDLVFLDAIVKLVNESHKPIPFEMRKNSKLFTSSMASNYIKQGLTPPPVGKKYTRDHICRIYFASMMKLVFSTDSVLALTNKLFTEDNVASVNDALAETFEHSIGCYAVYGLAALEGVEEVEEKGGRRRIANELNYGKMLEDEPWCDLEHDVFMLVNFVADTFASKAVSVAMLGGKPFEEQ